LAHHQAMPGGWGSVTSHVFPRVAGLGEPLGRTRC
jgi:hypothetical protein